MFLLYASSGDIVTDKSNVSPIFNVALSGVIFISVTDFFVSEFNDNFIKMVIIVNPIYRRKEFFSCHK